MCKNMLHIIFDPWISDRSFKFSIENLVKNNRIFMLWFHFFVIPLCPLSPIEGFFNN